MDVAAGGVHNPEKLGGLLQRVGDDDAAAAQGGHRLGQQRCRRRGGIARGEHHNHDRTVGGAVAAAECASAGSRNEPCADADVNGRGTLLQGNILLAADGDRGGRVGGPDGLADGVSDLLHLRPRNTVWCMRETTRVQ